jgi:GAF domain-containing protein
VIALLEMISRLDTAIRCLDREADRAGLFEIAADLAQEARRLDSERGEQSAKIEALMARLERLELIHRVGKTLIEVPCIEDSIQRVVDTIATTLNYCRTAVLLLDPDLEELDLISAYGYGEVNGLRIPLTQGATGYAARQAESVNIADVTTDPRYVKSMNRCRSNLAVPIIFDNEVLGVIDVESPEFGAFGVEDVKTIEVIASYAAAAIQHARVRESVEKQSNGGA